MNTRALLRRLRERFPFVVIAVIFGWSAWVISRREAVSIPEDHVVIRLAHWQLEPGVRDGFAEAAREYERLHPKVRVLQEAIPETTYGQWLSTQLIGGTAPDIVQAGGVPPSQLTAFHARYFLPITERVGLPNPYNAGTDLEGRPFISTFKDNLARSFIPEVQEYMTVPLGMVSHRVFYNRDLLEKLTGSREAPEDYRAFLAVCEKIAASRMPDGRPYYPIAGSEYHFSMWRLNLFEPLTFDVFPLIDYNRDGLFSRDEMFLGFACGRIDLDHPAYRACFGMVAEVARHFPPGWTGLNRDEAIFSFAQQRTLFMPTGLYEAEGIWMQAEGKFEIGMMDFPRPAADDPVYGGVMRGPRYEQPEGGMPMAITRDSPHADVAFDFLQFMASRAQNETFNRRLKWIPIIRGARPAEGISLFEPNQEGIFAAFDPNLGPESTIRWSQLFTLYQIGQLSLDDLADQFTRFYTTTGRRDYDEFLRNERRAQLRSAQIAMNQRRHALATADDHALPWSSYRSLMLGSLNREAQALERIALLADPGRLAEIEPYGYSPAALERIRQTLSSPPAAPVSP